jgi:SAM-dependent methyltransferase
MEFSAAQALSRVQRSLLPALDIVEQRVDEAEIPAWCARRGWSDFLLGLDDADLERCEAEGLASVTPSLAGVPTDLSELAERVRELCVLPRLETPLIAHDEAEFRGVSWRKRQQLTTLLGVLAPLVSQARRIVDVGAGSGHFARLSARHFALETLGLERSSERVARASARARADAGVNHSHTAEFAVIDVVREPLELRAGDLAIGLHACGELGDTLVRRVASSGADLGLISCCLQKISGPERASLSHAAGNFALRKDSLGLSNLSSRAVGVEASIEHTMRARQARYALRLLLRARGLELAPGAEMHGINRRRAHAGLSDIAPRALAQRGLSAPSADELAGHERTGARRFGAMRRLSLPRNMLARLVELSVILDRAAWLEENGFALRIAALFERAVSPRNIALFASKDAARLPHVRA